MKSCCCRSGPSPALGATSASAPPSSRTRRRRRRLPARHRLRRHQCSDQARCAGDPEQPGRRELRQRPGVRSPTATASSPGPDCNDNDAKINPKARDIPGDKIDQDCSGRRAPFRRFSGKLDVTGGTRGSITTIRTFFATKVPSGTKVEVRCTGRWCKRKSRVLHVKRARNRVDVARLLRSRRVPSGTVLELRISRKEFRSEALRVRTRTGRGPRKTLLCASPGKPFRPC